MRSNKESRALSDSTQSESALGEVFRRVNLGIWRRSVDGADMLIYGVAGLSRVNHAMMYLDAPPRLIETRVFSAMPDHFRRKGVRTDWADANRPGQPIDCFIEGPSFDADGNLYVVDIPFGRIFRNHA
jgi:gluconolactonase